jgi:hypothetical protein
MDSSRWQSIASIPEKIFEEHVEHTKQAKQELTSAGMPRLAKMLNRQSRRDELQETENTTSADTPPETTPWPLSRLFTHSRY